MELGEDPGRCGEKSGGTRRFVMNTRNIMALNPRNVSCAPLRMSPEELHKVQENTRKGQISSLSAPIGADNEK